LILQVMQIYQMDAMNFQFISHPNAWVVHRPHAPSSGYNHTFTGRRTCRLLLPCDQERKAHQAGMAM
jgi:hypothetical protein